MGFELITSAVLVHEYSIIKATRGGGGGGAASIFNS